MYLSSRAAHEDDKGDLRLFRWRVGAGVTLRCDRYNLPHSYARPYLWGVLCALARGCISHAPRASTTRAHTDALTRSPSPKQKGAQGFGCLRSLSHVLSLPIRMSAR